ncbi:hypothetical protein NEUTE1DRAFT_120118 [Neurospora tetrasperma FGSC 2508]|uniref:Uncharacterized protein n=1 Tax=Neurospora tetrasperma (strain FGSC 2508 / ATCC MYA-4615 / P0657) TaxID=510951 RepID=F8MB90_NEUT8|nr:uncharacterized protein NEUTE1DRAFT_120118 [Neurospora tetrasperma FGSC 2508]EGO61055.1 hypothetical protein NEUTE1DRAFT_120118 [Neurospora tetrasperma FGSC 2508]
MYGLQTSSGVYSTALMRIQAEHDDNPKIRWVVSSALKELEDTERPFSEKQKQVPDECSHRHLQHPPWCTVPRPKCFILATSRASTCRQQQSHLCLDLSQLSISPLTPCYTTHQSTSESHSFTRTGTHHQLTFLERHYSYECKASAAERPYIPRPSRTQQLFNPKLLPKLTSAVPPQDKKGVADEILAQREAERAKKKELERDDESPSRDVSPRRSRSLLAIPSHLHGEHMRKTSLSHRPRRLRPANAQSTPGVGILAGGQRARSSTHRGKGRYLLVVVRRRPAVSADVTPGGQGHPGATILFPSPDPGHQFAHRSGETAEEKITGQEDTTGTGKMAVDSRDTGVRRRNDLQSANRLPRHRRASGVSALSARD